MASIMMHLVVAEKYLEKHKDEDRVPFLRGTIEPDVDIERRELHKEKKGTHYGRRVFGSSVYELMNTKVDLAVFLKSNNIDTSYNRGVFLHLIFDDMFFRLVYEPEYENIPWQKVVADRFDDYACINYYIENKYGTKSIFPLPAKVLSCKDKLPSILRLDDFENFIDILSAINLDKTKEEILRDYQRWREGFYEKFGRRPKIKN